MTHSESSSKSEDSMPWASNCQPILEIVSVLPVRRTEDGRTVVTRKFVEGLSAYRRSWPGEMVVYMPLGSAVTGNLDDVALSPDEFPCEIRVLEYGQFADSIMQTRNALVLLSLEDCRQARLPRVCAQARIPFVFVSENNLRTRLQIIDLTERNPLKRLRRRVWEYGEEKRRRKALSLAAGLQTNGTPTFDDYLSIQPEALLFFDSRVDASMLASEEQVREKFRSGVRSRPLRLLYSGRLTAIKGVMDLIEVAKELKQREVDFELAICGGGDLSGALQRAVQAHDLGDCVTLRGVLDFATELVPLVKSSADVFVCCHRQGDPSCTYLETMSCGVPIAGYGNDALTGIVRHSGTGWLAPIGRPDLLASEIERLASQRDELLAASLKALGFARQHTFEKTFERRVAHFCRIADRSLTAQPDA